MDTTAILSELVESAPDAMVVASEDGRIVLVNAQAEKVFGYPRGELLGRPIEMLLLERLRASHRQHRAEYVQAPVARPWARGSVEISLSGLTAAGALVVVAAIRDVTEQRRLEAALKKREARLRALFRGQR